MTRWVLILVIITLLNGDRCLSAKTLQGLSNSQVPVVIGTQWKEYPGYIGSWSIFLENKSNEVMDIRNVYVSKNKLNKIPILCWKLFPEEIKSGEIGEIRIKVDPKHLGDKSLYRIVTTSGQQFGGLLPDQCEDISIDSVTFSKDLEVACVYVVNNSNETKDFHLYDINPQIKNSKVRIINQNLMPGDKGCIVVKNKVPFVAGKSICVAVKSHNKISRMIVKVKPCLLGEKRTSKQTTKQYKDLMICAANRYGNWKGATKKCKELSDSLSKQDRSALNSIYISRMLRPWSYLAFGDLTDRITINMFLPNKTPCPNNFSSEKYTHPFLDLARFAKVASSSGYFQAMIPISGNVPLFVKRKPTPEDLRFMVFSAVAMGAKDISWHGKGYKETQSELFRIRKTINQLSPLLAIAEPVGWGESENQKVFAQGLLCGNKAFMIILLRKESIQVDDDNYKLHPSKLQNAINNLEISFRLPPEVKLIKNINCPITGLPIPIKSKKEKFYFNTTFVSAAQIYVVDFEKQDSEE